MRIADSGRSASEQIHDAITQYMHQTGKMPERITIHKSMHDRLTEELKEVKGFEGKEPGPDGEVGRFENVRVFVVG